MTHESGNDTCASLSVIIATYNRAEVLRQTLEAMCAVKREGLRVEFVLIDNNSKDNTAEVIDSFTDRLPIRHLFQPKPGKSAALNLALDTVDLGGLVVFTDDDVVPRTDWLTQIHRASQEHPEHDVFGGRVQLAWPENLAVPGWAYHTNMQWVFNPHDLGPDACPYPPGQYPPGANTWIRRELCVSNRYDESRGPGNAHAPGEDTLFVMALMTQGHPPAYVGYAEIGHRVHPSLLSPLEVTKRAFRYGRGIPYTRALPRESLLFRHRYLWLAMKLISVARHGLTALLLSVPIPNERRFLLSVQATMTFGINVGHLNKAWNYRRVTDTLNCPI